MSWAIAKKIESFLWFIAGIQFLVIIRQWSKLKRTVLLCLITFKKHKIHCRLQRKEELLQCVVRVAFEKSFIDSAQEEIVMY